MNILPFRPISTLHVIVVLKWGCCGCCRLKLWKGDNQHVRNQAPTRRGRGGNWCTKWINCYWSWCFPKGIIQQWYVTCYWDFWLIKSLLKPVVFLSFEEVFALWLYHMWSCIVLCSWNWYIYFYRRLRMLYTAHSVKVLCHCVFMFVTTLILQVVLVAQWLIGIFFVCVWLFYILFFVLFVCLFSSYFVCSFSIGFFCVDLRVINAWKKKGIFCRTESVAMTPKSCDHMPTTSLWGVTAKWPTRAPKTKLILCPREPQGYSRVSLSLSGRILKEYWNIMSASKQTPCSIPWGLRNRTYWSARYTKGRDAVQQESQLVWTV